MDALFSALISMLTSMSMFPPLTYRCTLSHPFAQRFRSGLLAGSVEYRWRFVWLGFGEMAEWLKAAVC